MPSRNNITDYVRQTSKRSLNDQREYYLFNDIFVFVKDPLPNYIDIVNLLETIEKRIPSHLLHDIESIFVGQFDDFVERQTNAFYKDGAIYVTNDQDNDKDMLDDIVHEIAHAAEKTFATYIYSNKMSEEEFLGKRHRMYSILKSEEVEDLPSIEKFKEVDYSREFDEFLFMGVGYPLLANLTMGLFTSPYAATSLKEYFATGFEEYFIGDANHLKNISPILYNTINEITNLY